MRIRPVSRQVVHLGDKCLLGVVIRLESRSITGGGHTVHIHLERSVPIGVFDLYLHVIGGLVAVGIDNLPSDICLRLRRHRDHYRYGAVFPSVEINRQGMRATEIKVERNRFLRSTGSCLCRNELNN